MAEAVWVDSMGVPYDAAGNPINGGGNGRGNGYYYPTRRSRGMYMRKGRLFMGFSQKEVKNAMRRTYGGTRRSK
jgi:hypothetical protein